MRQSHLFTKTQKEAPKDEVSKNAKLLIRAGFVYKEMAGVYTMLPMGLKVINKIAGIIREELFKIGCQEIKMTALQNPEIWKITDRWDRDKVDTWFKTKLNNNKELGLALTHEEPLTKMLKNYIHSYKDLPAYVFQIQTKFRNELRAKSGLMRGREFLMKDLYSFNKNDEERQKFYDLLKKVYMKIFEKVGLGGTTYETFASGGIFSQFSHEFQTLSDAGEDTIYIHKEKRIAINKEILTDQVLKMLDLKREELAERRSIEVGNIFPLGTKYSEALGLVFADSDGITKPVVMGSYGIGLGRLMGTIVEVHQDKDGIVWPQSVSPYQAHLISLCKNEETAKADFIYKSLIDAGIDVLYDDRPEINAGQKFVDSDLIGIPVRAVVSLKTLKNGSVEIKLRGGKETRFVKIEELAEKLKQKAKG